MNFLITCNSGTEALVKKELTDLNINITKVADRLVFFEGDESAIADVNLWSRVGNKVYIVLGKTEITSFNDLFEYVYSFDWNFFIKKGQSITVQGNSIASKLASVPTIQAMGKKAIVKKLLNGKEGNLPEDENKGKIEVTLTLDNDECYVLLNTTGVGLHQRGYKKYGYEAPIKENLAATCVLLSGWKFGQEFCDFFCGSGTIIVEAALIAKNIAPGIFRKFDFMNFQWFDQNLFSNAVYVANQQRKDKKFKIYGSDIEKGAIDIAHKHAVLAGVDDIISLEVRNFEKFNPKDFTNTCVVSNPPYGLRLKQDNIGDLYKSIDNFYENSKKITGGIFTGYELFGRMINLKHWKSRKLYNGGEKCYFYKYEG